MIDSGHKHGGHGHWGGPRGGFGFGGRPGGPRGHRARRGDIRGVILMLLKDGPANGYSLIAAVEERSGGVWRPSPGSIYPTLQQLVDEELIEPVDATSTRTDYQLTDAGREHLAGHEEHMKEAWGPMADALSEQAPLIEAANKLATVLRMIGDDGTPEQRTETVEKINNLRRELHRMLGD